MAIFRNKREKVHSLSLSRVGLIFCYIIHIYCPGKGHAVIVIAAYIIGTDLTRSLDELSMSMCSRPGRKPVITFLQ